MQARALWIVGEQQAELRSEALPQPKAGEVRVRTEFSGVSRGTESLVLRGGVPEDQRETMRAPFQAGAFPWPVKYGYTSVGRIEAGALPLGTPVFCLFPHQDAYVVPVEAVTRVPDGLPLQRVVLASNLETALNAAWDSGVGPGDRVSVVGGGVVGGLTAWLLGRIPGVEVELIDVRSERRALADALGVSFASPEAARPDRDCVIEASGASAGLATAIAIAGVEARVVVLSWYGAGAVPVPLGGGFHSRRLTLRSSQVGRLPPERAPRFDLRRRLATVLSLLTTGPELEVLVDSEGSFAQLPDDLVRVAGGGGGVLCHRVRYGE